MSTFLSIFIGILIVAAIFVGFLFFRGSLPGGSPSSQNNIQELPIQNTDDSNATQSLGTEDVKEGEGPAAVVGDTLVVHYVGTLEDGTQFDSSRDRGTPFTFTLGEGKVIDGWEQGMLGMKVGGMRTLVVPPHLGYGATARPGIPANSTLTFEVELLEIQ
jgi:FKBP-type peptidyl-prolyl cis-trans isomerase